MIRLFFLVIISAIVLPMAYYGFKNIPLARRMTIAGGALAAAAVGLLLQTGFAWYLQVLALVAVSLVSTLVYMKLLEKEQKEKELEAEERKARRKEKLFPASSTTTAIPRDSAVKEREVNGEAIALTERETIKVPEEVFKPETLKVPELKKESQPEQEPERVEELVGAKPFGMQSIKPIGKEDQREQ